MANRPPGEKTAPVLPFRLLRQNKDASRTGLVFPPCRLRPNGRQWLSRLAWDSERDCGNYPAVPHYRLKEMYKLVMETDGFQQEAVIGNSCFFHRERARITSKSHLACGFTPSLYYFPGTI